MKSAIPICHRPVSGILNYGNYLKSLLSVFLLLPFYSISQTTISGTINDYTEVSNISGLFITVGSTTGFNAGDSILIYQAKGATINETNTSSFGDIISYGSAGIWEMNEIQSISGSDIEITSALTNSYDFTNGDVQVVRVPEYTGNVTVSATLTGLTWDGSKGGILALIADTLTLNADINMDARGFSGGLIVTSSQSNNTDFYAALGAQKGEGIAEYITGKDRLKGKQANGGGGGNWVNSAGGGGSNYGAGGSGGAYSNLDVGEGGIVLDCNTINRLFLGGGGGAGDDNNGGATIGGRGGGVIFIKANVIIGNNNNISSRGQNSANASGDASGGGGSGGSIYISTTNYNTTTNINVSGGSAGSVAGHGAGGGGGGGGGVLIYNAPLSANINFTANGGTGGNGGSASSALQAGDDGESGAAIPYSVTPAPSIGAGQTFLASKTMASGVVLLGVSDTGNGIVDASSSNGLQNWSIVSTGDIEPGISINASTGELTVFSSAYLNTLDDTIYTLTLTVENSSGSVSCEETIQIELISEDYLSDNDNDNIIDYIDLDDDNDGVLDTEELLELNELISPSSVDSYSSTFNSSHAINSINEVGLSGVGASATHSTTYSHQFLLLQPQTAGWIKYNAPTGTNMNEIGIWVVDVAAGGNDGPLKDFTVEVTYNGGNVYTSQMFTTAISNLGEIQFFTFDTLLTNVSSVQINILSGWVGSGTSFVSSDIATIPSNYNLGVAEVKLSARGKFFLDTDNDGVYNHLDLDSDGDGCYDSYEAGVTNATNTGAVTDSITAGPYGNNGLANAIEDVDLGTASVTYTSTYTNYAISNVLNTCSDYDNDGISDLIDIDDDNDGIPDVIESPNCYYTAQEVAQITDVSSELNIYASYIIENSYDGDNATQSALTTGQNWVDVDVYRITPTQPMAIKALEYDPVSWRLSGNASSLAVLQGYDGSTWTNLTTPVYLSATTGTVTMTNTLATGTVFQEFRITGTSGTVYYAGVREFRLIPVDSFVVANYPKSSCSDDHDNDGVYNHLDLDSDGDGCYDSYEAGVTNATNTGAVTDSITAGPYGNNGLANAIEDVDQDTAIVSYTSTYTRYALSDFLNACSDSDNDGIGDLVDIDDDNDGIPDAVEAPNCYYTAQEVAQITNVTTELNLYSTYVVENSFDGDNTTRAALTTGQNWVNVDVYRITPTQPMAIKALEYDPVSWRLSGNASSLAVLQGYDGSTWTNLTTPVYLSATTGTVTMTNTLATGTIFQEFRITGTSGTVYYAGVTEFRLIPVDNFVAANYPKLSCSDDHDNDGIYNHLDLDSDGDGCYDSYEAGVTNATNTGAVTDSITAGPYGNNGLANAIEDVDQDMAMVSYTSTYTRYALSDFLNACSDSDNDGIGDLVDIDDDNDGIPDAVEAPNCYYTAQEVAQITNVTTELNIYSTYVVENAFDGDNTTRAALTTGQNWVNVDVYRITPTEPMAIKALEYDPVSWRLSGNSTSLAVLQGYDGSTWTNLTTPVYLSATTGTVTMTNTLATGTVFQEFRITGTSGTVYYAGVREFRLIPVDNFVAANYPKLSCSDDHDNDGVYNHLDLDSDGDGCYDSYEAGVTNATNTGAVTDSITAGPYGNNGLANAIEDVDQDTAIVSYTSTYTRYALSDFLNACSDSDNDGIGDLVDIDDDNDGIPDAVEAPNCYYTAQEVAQITNVTTELNLYSTYVVENAFDGDNSTLSALTTGQNWVNVDVYRITPTQPMAIKALEYDPVSWRLSGNASSLAVLQGYDGSTWTNLTTPVYLSATTGTVTMTNTLATGTVFQEFRITGTSGTVYYAGVREFRLIPVDNFVAANYPKLSCSDDHDNDGIYNHLDLDSDGDGCYDSYEAGVTNATNTGTVTDSITAGPYGNNGLANAIEDVDQDTAMVSYTSTYTRYALSDFLNACSDSDNDGIGDLVDIDDDNDGIPDAVEAPNCYYTAQEVAQITNVTTELNIYSTYVVENSFDGDNTTRAALTTGQNWVNVDVYRITPTQPMAIKALEYDPVSWRLSGNSTSLAVLQGYDGSSWTNLTTPVYLSATTGTVTMTNTLATGTVFQEFRITGTSGTVYYAGVREFRLIPVDNFVAANYPKLSCSDDHDNDGVYNHLDLDSDGDGCYDSYEAGVTNTTNTGAVTDSITAGPYGNNGLANAIEDVDQDTAMVSYTSTYSLYAIDSSVDACIDSDNDGIVDVIDLDDDNDAIPDKYESDCAPITKTASDLTWHGTAAGNISNPTSTTLSISGAAWEIAYTDQTYELPLTIEGTITSATNGMFGIFPIDGTEVTSSWNDGAYKFQYNASNGMYVRHGALTSGWHTPSIINRPFKLTVDAAGNMEYHHNGSVVYSGTIPVKEYKITFVRGASTISDFKITTKDTVCVDIDTDNDGIPNRLDLDSDNDLCFDGYEAGADWQNRPIRPGVTYGNNGLSDLLETNDGMNADITYQIRDSVIGGETFINFITASITCATPLPVTLTDFYVHSSDNRTVDIIWEVVSEINCDYYIIEKSNDGLNWELLTNVQGSGTSSNKIVYHEKDNEPYNGITYYQLLQVDFDGAIHHLGVRKINLVNALAGQINAYPNPIAPGGRLYVDLKDKQSDMIVQLINAEGKLVMINDFSDQINNGLFIDIPVDIKSGLYIVRLISETSTESIKIMVAK